MKKFIILLLSLCIFSCSKPETKFYDTNNHVVVTKGKWAIINYWAVWCESCVKEMPELNQFYKNNKDPNVVVYGVNYDNLDVKDLHTAIKKLGIKFPVLTDNPTQSWKLEEVNFLPITFIINPTGKVVQKIVGPSTESSLTTTLKKLQADENN